MIRPEGIVLDTALRTPAMEAISAHVATLRLMEMEGLMTGPFPPVLGEEALARAAKILMDVPGLPPARALHAVCPHTLFAEQPRSIVDKSLAKFKLGDVSTQNYIFDGVRPGESRTILTGAIAENPNSCKQIEERHTSQAPASTPALTLPIHEHTGIVTLRNTSDNSTVDLNVPAGPSVGHRAPHFVDVASQQHALAEMMIAISAGDVLLVGARGCGKSALAGQLAALLGFAPVHVMLHKDMSARDLLQQRVTDSNGDTAWRLSALATAAMDGRQADLIEISGIERI